MVVAAADGDLMNLNMHEPLARTRVVIVFIGVLFLISGYGFWVARDVEIYLPLVWPVWMLCAGVSCIVFAFSIHSAFWWQTSRIFVVIGALSRVGSLLSRALAGELPNPWSALGGAALYLICASALFRLWDVEFRWWSRRETARRR